MEQAIKTEKLGRVFKTRQKGSAKEIAALTDVDIEIPPGELFGLLGPNGAGKTTLIKILTTLLLPTSGRAYVCGHDVDKDVIPIRKTINMVAGGEYSGYGLLSVYENLWLFSQFYNVNNSEAKRRIEDLLRIVNLEDKTHTRLNQLSTGMRQKLNFARGFINDPKILFLDEPTLGLDVSTSKDLRKYMRSWLSEDPARTVLLTTHYMAEADELCDRVAIINEGRIIACDSPDNLKKSIPYSSSFEIQARSASKDFHELGSLDGVKGFSLSEAGDGESLCFKFVLRNEYPLEQIFNVLIHKGASIISMKKTDITLEDVFLTLCGRGLGD